MGRDLRNRVPNPYPAAPQSHQTLFEQTVHDGARLEATHSATQHARELNSVLQKTQRRIQHRLHSRIRPEHCPYERVGSPRAQLQKDQALLDGDSVERTPHVLAGAGDAIHERPAELRAEQLQRLFLPGHERYADARSDDLRSSGQALSATKRGRYEQVVQPNEGT